MKDDIEQLQTTLAFQEHSLAELHEALLAQQKQLDFLQLQVRLLQGRLEDIEAGGGPKSPNPGEERPPHY